MEFVLQTVVGIRVNESEEIEGLGTVECGQQDYPEFTGTGDVLVTPS